MRPLLWSGGTILGGYLYQSCSSRTMSMVGIDAMAGVAILGMMVFNRGSS